MNPITFRNIKAFLRNNYIAFSINGGGKTKYWERTYNKVVSKYSSNAPKTTDEKKVIVMVDGKSGSQNGLADRLRGILSVYSICREENLSFKIYWTYPFPLSEYIIPNRYNWQIDGKSVSTSIENTQISCRYVLGKVLFESWIDRRHLRKVIKDQTKEQLHIYTNSIFARQDFHLYFDELFKPSQELDGAIKENLNLIGTKYYSASFRFLDLLGDFKEEVPSHTTLNKNQKLALVQECIAALQSFIKSVPTEYKILVASDSVTFLEVAKKMKRVYVVPGEIYHTCSSTGGSFPFMKTFLDFYMLKNAESVHLFKNSLMYESGFPKLAALCGKRPFFLHKF